MLAISRTLMQTGAFGISSGLEYVPGRFADVDELVNVSRPVAERDGIHTMHMRSEGPNSSKPSRSDRNHREERCQV